MSDKFPRICNGYLEFSEAAGDADLEKNIKRQYGRGIFIQDSYEAPNGQIRLELGTSYPKDVRDLLGRDTVADFATIGDIITLCAEPVGDEYYKIDLPEERAIHESCHAQRKEIIDQLDWSMANAICEDVYHLNPVRNRLHSLVQIVRRLQREPEISVERVGDILKTVNARVYLQVLDDLEFVALEEDIVRPGARLAAAETEAAERSDQGDVDGEEYERIAIGSLIRDEYGVLRDRLGLRPLNQYPKFANSYYFSALQREDPDIWLDRSALLSNLKGVWDEEVDPRRLDDKLRELEKANVVETDDGSVRGNRRIYRAVSSDARSLPFAD